MNEIPGPCNLRGRVAQTQLFSDSIEHWYDQHRKNHKYDANVGGFGIVHFCRFLFGDMGRFKVLCV